MSLFRWRQRLTGQAARAAPLPAPPAGLRRVVHCSMPVPHTAPPVHATLRDALATTTGGFVPAALVAQKAKSVSDGIVAALDALSTDSLPPWLEALRGRLASGEAAERVDAALDLARAGSSDRPVAAAMLADPLRAKPLGFYTWSRALERVFVRDRFLQEHLGDGEAAALAAALAGDPALCATYRTTLCRAARLADRLSPSTVSLETRLAGPHGPRGRPSTGGEAIVPPSEVLESGYPSIAAFFAAVRGGACDLTPAPESGFYAHQRYALTALLCADRTPEARARTIDAEYAAALERLAGAALFFARETHVKQIAVAALTAPMLRKREIVPGLTIEPVPSFYRLTAAAFRFLREGVVDGWSSAALATPQLRAAGATEQTLGEGIDEVIALCEAAAELSLREIDGATDDDGTRSLRARVDALRSDDDAVGDARGMVPLAIDPASGKVRVAALVGWELQRLHVQVTHAEPSGDVGERGSESHALPVPVVREAWVRGDQLLSRDEVRRLCDALMTLPLGARAIGP